MMLSPSASDERVILPREPEPHRGCAFVGRRPVGICGSAAECIPHSVHSSDEDRRLRVIVNRTPYLPDGHVEVGINDEDIRPDLAKQVCLRDHARPLRQEDTQHGECFRRKMNVLTVARELPRFRIEHEFGKESPHRRLQDLENPS